MIVAENEHLALPSGFLFTDKFITSWTLTYTDNRLGSLSTLSMGRFLSVEFPAKTKKIIKRESRHRICLATRAHVSAERSSLTIFLRGWRSVYTALTWPNLDRRDTFFADIFSKIVRRAIIPGSLWGRLWYTLTLDLEDCLPYRCQLSMRVSAQTWPRLHPAMGAQIRPKFQAQRNFYEVELGPYIQLWPHVDSDRIWRDDQCLGYICSAVSQYTLFVASLRLRLESQSQHFTKIQEKI